MQISGLQRRSAEKHDGRKLHRNSKQGKGTAIMDKKEAIKKLKKYKEMLSKEMVFDKMILFGSYAQGNPREDSDIDVAIIVNKIQGDFFSTRPLLWRIRREVDDRIEPVILETGHDEGGFLKEVIKTGIII
jgi:predicted nucleotidyltransferase